MFAKARRWVKASLLILFSWTFTKGSRSKTAAPTATFWTLGPLDPEKERTSFAKLKSYIDKKNCTLRFGNHWPVWHLPKRNSPTSFAKEPIVRWHSFPTHSFSSGGLSASDTYTWRHFVPASFHPCDIFALFEGKREGYFPPLLWTIVCDVSKCYHHAISITFWF